MAPRAPRTDLATHTVLNQPPPFEDVNFYTTDAALRDAVTRHGAAAHADGFAAFGAKTGSAETAELAHQANRNPPELQVFDRFGGRIDEVSFHPAYHALMALGIGHGVTSAAWTAQSAGHVTHAALLFMMTQAEAGVCCPMSMTYACVPPLRHAPDLEAIWAPRVRAGQYDAESRPARDKAGATLGMAMTEKQGGSDVRSNTTAARPQDDGAYELLGHKWFCSAPMSDAFLTLAHVADAGPTCFLVPRWRPDDSRNPIHIMRLKDKLGDRANASSEIEYHHAWAVPVGAPGHGVRTIIDMVHHTRLDCTIAPAAMMRQAVANAIWHCDHRTAFQRKLIDQPLMQRLLADLVVESEAATALAFRVAASFDGTAVGDPREKAISRIATPVGKYWLNKRVPGVVYEAMEAHGGIGYVEDSGIPRLYRQAPLNSIWEGSGNVICLDVLRALSKSPEAGDALLAELDAVHGADPRLDRARTTLADRLQRPDLDEGEARRLTESMAVALQGACLVRHGPAPVADAFCDTRLDTDSGMSFGTLPSGVDFGAILERGRAVM